MTDAKHTAELIHTDEPWQRDGTAITDSAHHPQTIATTSPKICGPGMTTATLNAQRIVSCVNACENIPNPADFVKAAREFSRAVGIALSGDASDNWEQRIRDALKAFRAAGGGE